MTYLQRLWKASHADSYSTAKAAGINKKAFKRVVLDNTSATYAAAKRNKKLADYLLDRYKY
jgi:hypothetical protein